jgi:hypothetical protein
VAFTPVKGKFCQVTDNAGTPNVYPGVNWTLGIDPKLADTSNFRDGRKTDETLTDADISFTLVYDEDKPPDKSSGMNLIAGQAVTLKLFVNNEQTVFYQIPVRLGPISLKNEGVEKIMMYDVKAKQNGPIVYPVWT